MLEAINPKLVYGSKILKPTVHPQDKAANTNAAIVYLVFTMFLLLLLFLKDKNPIKFCKIPNGQIKEQ